jgi:U3 small nucleolar RNA-associated protein 23
MRGKRAKKYRKLMHQYEVNFNFRQPYQVLLDSQILQDCARAKIDIVNRLTGVLGGEVKPMVSQCDMRHLYNATPKDEQLILQAKGYERKRCGHHELEEPLSSLECLSACVDPKGTLTNKHKYCVATQDPKIRQAMRKIPGVPLIYVSKSVMILEPMADATEQLRERTEKAKFKEGLKGRRGASTNTGEKRKRDNEDEGAQADGNQSIVEGDRPQKKKRAKGPKGPNPLSIKKAKKTQDGEPAKPRTPKPAKPEHADLPVEDAAEAAGVEGGEEAAKRKRKRKHKPKGDAGDGGVAVETEGQMDTS